MPKRALRPRYHACRRGWFVQISGKRICLARGEPDDRSVWAAAVKAWWKVGKVPVKDQFRAVDWVTLSRERGWGVERAQRDWVRWWTEGRTDLDMLLLLKKEYDLLLPDLANYVPLPPTPRAATDAEVEHEWEARREEWGGWAPLLRLVGDRLGLEERAVVRLGQELAAGEDGFARAVIAVLGRAASG